MAREFLLEGILGKSQVARRAYLSCFDRFKQDVSSIKNIKYIVDRYVDDLEELVKTNPEFSYHIDSARAVLLMNEKVYTSMLEQNPKKFDQVKRDYWSCVHMSVLKNILKRTSSSWNDIAFEFSDYMCELFGVDITSVWTVRKLPNGYYIFVDAWKKKEEKNPHKILLDPEKFIEQHYGFIVHHCHKAILLGYDINHPDPKKRSHVVDFIENNWGNSDLVSLDDHIYGPHERGMVIYAKSLHFSLSQPHKLHKNFVGIQMLKVKKDEKDLDYKPSTFFTPKQFDAALHLNHVLLKVLQEL
tara:strand:+ start:200 stop:1099 length:900 start_codon:yes stop_codon:yes gene_type:complete